ncbi:MAG: hypothetical protein IJ762_07500 [Bacteroidaceae bacterium]|nr:hypothetical protein [Bacteroidaceae bacterium]MBR1789012.1 hypothetical protein [Bacteroidaceae bacterium]
MKRKYNRPATEAICLQPLHHLTEVSEIPIGGKGGFDVKRHYGNWEIDWGGTVPIDENEEKSGNTHFTF